MRFIIFLFAILQFKYVCGQNSCACKCSYISHYRLDLYFNEADSISSRLLKRYKGVKVIGVRAFSEAKLMFVVDEGGKTIGMYYDLMAKKHKTFSGRKLDAFIKAIISDSIFLQRTKPLPDGSVSKNFSFFISYDYPKRKLFDVCYTQLLRDIKRPSSAALMGFPDEF